MLQSRIVFKGSRDWHRKSITLDLTNENGHYQVLCHFENEFDKVTRVMYDGDDKMGAEHHFMTGFHHYIADEYVINSEDKSQKEQALFWFHRAVESLYFRIAQAFGLDPMGAWKVNSYFTSENDKLNEIGLRLKKFSDAVPEDVKGFVDFEEFKKNSKSTKFKKGRF